MAIAQTRRLPEVFNTDQGSQFSSQEWTGELIRPGIAISMDGKGRWMDNVFIERVWHRAKHEDIHLREYASLPALEAGLEAWVKRSKAWRPHQALGQPHAPTRGARSRRNATAHAGKRGSRSMRHLKPGAIPELDRLPHKAVALAWCQRWSVYPRGGWGKRSQADR